MSNNMLREKIAAEVQAYARYMASGAGTPLDVADRVLALPEWRELEDLRNIVLASERDVTVGHLVDLFGWQSMAKPLNIKVASPPA